MKTWLPWVFAGLGFVFGLAGLDKASGAASAISDAEEAIAHASHRIDELESQVEEMDSKIEALEGEIPDKADESDLQALGSRVSDLEDK